ncbi:MAG: sensor histidine kinase [Bifidobacteriaceae bacterium]|nr:sensor histidine kinase [Bifidobacteriaceae bacterium]
MSASGGTGTRGTERGTERGAGIGRGLGQVAAQHRGLIGATVAICTLALAMVALSVATMSPTVPVTSASQLTGFDFRSSIARVEAQSFDWYPSALYTPEDFTAGVAESPQPITRHSGQFGTYRLVANLTPGEVYGLTAYSATYSQRLWVDGELLTQVGVPGADATSTVPGASYYTVYFTAQRGGSEIVVQRAEFVHAQGGQLYPQFLGTQRAITAMVDKNRLRSGIILGSTLVAGMFLLGFFLVSRRRQFLWFALACLAIVVRTASIDQKLIMVLAPDMGWRMSHGLEACATLSFVFFLLAYLNRMVRGQLPRAVPIANAVLLAVGMAVVLFLPSTVYSKLIPTLQIVYLGLVAGVFAMMCWLMAKDRSLRGIGQYLVLAGLGVLGATTLTDVTRYRSTGQYDDLNLVQVGMVVFVFTNMLALALDFAGAEQALARTRRQASELEQRDRMRRAFLSEISHEMRTPLTVMSNYAQYTRTQVEDGTVDAETAENLLTITVEANRLAMMVEQLLSTSVRRQDAIGRVSVAPASLLTRAAALCRPILQGRGNLVEVDAVASCPDVLAGADLVIQVLTNLCINANRHTRLGTVHLTAFPQGDMVEFAVEDTGDGVAPGLAPHVFERGVSGDGEAGLGLAICKDVVELHGGAIRLDSSPGRGTRVAFTLPVAGGEGLGGGAGGHVRDGGDGDGVDGKAAP